MLKGGLITIFSLVLITLSSARQNSILSTGKWYKFSVTEDGIYKIDYNLLKRAGINPDQIDPRRISLYAAGNGMLPQLNSAPRIGKPTEIAISVSGEQDGEFNREDAILFYGQGPDEVNWFPSKNIFNYKNHLYTDKNYYFLTISDREGKRIAQSENIGGTFPIITQFDDFAYYETDKYNILSSGREWYGEQFSSNSEVRIRFELSGIVEGSNIKVVSHVMGQSQEETSFKLFFNNIEVVKQIIPPVPGSTYSIKGRRAEDTVSFAASSVNAASQNIHEIKYQYTKPSLSVGYLDFITITTKRKLNWNGNPFIFTSSQSIQNPISSFSINSFPANGRVWNVSDAFNSTEQSLTTSSNTGVFSTSTSSLKKFLAFSEVRQLPTFESEIGNQNLQSSTSPTLLIVTHPNFKSEALRLAKHRQSHNKITVQVVTTDEVFNEFAGGKPDLTTIRDFARHLYQSGNLKNLLLFGRCSYDYKGKVIDNSNYVPTYQSRNSLSPLETYSSDDYFAFFDEAEGDWLESPIQNHTMEIGVGRISVKKIEDAKTIVDKLIAYDINEDAYGKWRKDILFVADDGDFNIHQYQSNQLADDIDTNQPEFNVNKLFLDSYKQLERPSGQYSKDATDALDRAINKGALIVNFTGHGSEQVWMDEKILDPSAIAKWKNRNRFPLFVTATCEFGRHDDPLLISSGELIMTKKNGGAIGLVTTARPVNSSTNFLLNRAFYNALFQKENGQYRTLGTIFRDTKNQSASGVANRNFSLLGDPSMKLVIAENKIELSDLRTKNGSDVLKALSNVLIKGEVRNNNLLMEGFTGTLQATLFDKRNDSNTLGNENPIFTYQSWDHIIFQGKASVVNGKFEMECIVPKSIAPEIGDGKISLYAYNNSYTNQASGASKNFKIGSSESSSDADSQGPEITLFMGDTTYRTGGAVASNTHLVAILKDEHGINISGYENGNLEITLDDTLKFIGNTFYEANLNNFRRGIMTYPINDLPKGNHTLLLKAWDTYGNLSEKSISFSVEDADQLIIDSFNNFPNPFAEKTNFQFSHNRSGEDLQAQLIIYNSMGQIIHTMEHAITESLYNVVLTEWVTDENGVKLNNGIYFARLQVRSLADGAKNEKLAKLIVLN
jgi:Peptidase family C25